MKKWGGGKLTGKQVMEIADARMKRKAQRDAQEAKSKMTDAASANAGLEDLGIRTNTLPRDNTSAISGNKNINIPSIGIADLPLPNINASSIRIDDQKGTFPDAATILAIQEPNKLEKVFRDILAKIKPNGQFSFDKMDAATFQALQAVYQNGKIPTLSVSGSEYAHGLANAIILSGEIGSNKTLITNRFELQEGYRGAIQQATSPADLRTRLTELNDPYGNIIQHGKTEAARKANILPNTGITPENRKIIEGAGYAIKQEGETVMIIGDKRGNISSNYVLSVDFPISDVKIEGGSLVITYLRGTKPLILPVQGDGRSTLMKSGREEITTLEGRTAELSRAMSGLNASTGLVYDRLGTRLSEGDSGKELMQKFLTDSRFTPIRESIAGDVIAKAKIVTGGFLGYGKKTTFPEIADKGIGDILLKGVGSYAKIGNGMEFEVAGKTYVIGNSRDPTEGVVLLSKEEASKSKEQPVRFT